MEKIIEESLKNHMECLAELTENKELLSAIERAATEIANCYRNRGKTLWIGNGGSATQAEHLAGELSGKFLIDRKPLPALTPYATASLTAIANDYSYDSVFSRFVESLITKGDVLVGLSTSGNSKNVVNAMKLANESGAVTIGFTGKNGGDMKKYAKCLIAVPSEHTPTIQEMHIMIGHIICEIVEGILVKEGRI